MSISKTYGLAIATLALFVSAVVASPVSAANNSEKNHPSYWENKGYGSCVKYDGVNKKTFTVPSIASGKVYSLAVVKASTIHDEDTSVNAGDVLRHSTGKDISHVTLCTKNVNGSTPQGQVLGDQETVQGGNGQGAGVTVLPATGVNAFLSVAGSVISAGAAYVATRRIRL